MNKEIEFTMTQNQQQNRSKAINLVVTKKNLLITIAEQLEKVPFIDENGNLLNISKLDVALQSVFETDKKEYAKLLPTYINFAVAKLQNVDINSINNEDNETSREKLKQIVEMIEKQTVTKINQQTEGEISMYNAKIQELSNENKYLRSELNEMKVNQEKTNELLQKLLSK